MTLPITKKDNPFKYGTDPELNQIFDKLVDLRDRVTREFAKAEKIAGFDENVGFLPLKDAVNSLPDYRELYEPKSSSQWGPRTRTSLEEIDKQVLAAIAAQKAHIEVIELENIPLADHNKKIVERVTEIMTRLGVTPNYSTYEYPTSRSRTKKQITHTAGYIGDLNRTVPKTNLPSIRYQLQEYERNYARWLTETREADKKARIEKDTETVNKKILGNPRLVATLMQAGVNILDEVQKAVPGEKAGVIDYCLATAIENTIKKDRYLRTGYYMFLSYKANRDFAESRNLANLALDALKSDTFRDDDQAIYDCIEDVIKSGKTSHVFYSGADWTIDNVFNKCKDGTLVTLIRELEDLADEL